MLVKRIISGGQSGADHGALVAAAQLGIATGGWMPKFFMTEDGPNSGRAALYKLQEHSAASYSPRTEANVQDADGTLIFGVASSAGSALTRKLCQQHGKPCFIQYWTSSMKAPWPSDATGKFRAWLSIHKIAVLNVAGNRESKNPGIAHAVEVFLLQTLGNNHLFPI